MRGMKAYAVYLSFYSQTTTTEPHNAAFCTVIFFPCPSNGAVPRIAFLYCAKKFPTAPYPVYLFTLYQKI